MPKIDASFNPEEYTPVAERIVLFYRAHPLGRITTRLLSYENGRAVVEASVYRIETSPYPAATGLASEREGDGDINAAACLENTETSAIGRALANLGITGSARRPSREEMEKAARARLTLTGQTVARPDVDAAASARSELGLGAPTASPRRVAEPLPYKGAELQERATEHYFALTLLRRAERAGLSPDRAAAMRSALADAESDPLARDRIALELRSWLRRQTGFLRTTHGGAVVDDPYAPDVRTPPP